jgi:hypothetical protein
MTDDQKINTLGWIMLAIITTALIVMIWICA